MMFTVSDHHVAGDGDTVTVHNSILLLEHLQGVPLKMDTCFGGLNFGTRFKGQECFKICYALAF